MIARFVLENILSRVLPGKIPPFFAFQQGQVREIEQEYDLSSVPDEDLAEMVRTNAIGVPMVFPLQMRSSRSDWWTLPFEPLISVNGKNVIVKKQISKSLVRGSIKERWVQDDYQVNISGILMNVSENAWPSEDVQRLRRLCEEGALEVSCPLLEIFSISRIVVESYSFPFTKGVRNQSYSISASSDDIYKLLLKREDLKAV